MNNINLDDFFEERECTYKDERYSVRDNGAVIKYPREGKRPRPTDNQWTFGVPNRRTGYMEIASARIHRIVATAFHGEAPTKEHVVDHIDTNRKNNRPENLRWLTRLENALQNPITVKRIIYACGSIEAFLENPSILQENAIEQDYQWMRTVSIEEGQASLKRLLEWAANDISSSEGKSLGEWLFKQYTPKATKKIINEDVFSKPTKNFDFSEITTKGQLVEKSQAEKTEEISDLVVSKTPNAVQRDWNIPSEFPCCPKEIGKNPIQDYAENLKQDLIFCRNDIYFSKVYKSGLSIDNKSICVISEASNEGAVKPFALAKITYKDGLFVHTSLGTFFSEEGADKQFTIERGLEWTGGDSIDDYC